MDGWIEAEDSFIQQDGESGKRENRGTGGGGSQLQQAWPTCPTLSEESGH